MADRGRFSLAAAVATFGGVGLCPWAPGTAGTLAALPLAWWTAGLPWPARAAVLAVVVGTGTWAAGRYGRETGKADAQEIVVDEVAGILLTLVATPRSVGAFAAGFVLFRLFDITKPPPARFIDRHVKTGVGVVLDDLVAGAYAAALLAGWSVLTPW